MLVTLTAVTTGLPKDDTELFTQLSDNDSFKKWLFDSVFESTHKKVS